MGVGSGLLHRCIGNGACISNTYQDIAKFRVIKTCAIVLYNVFAYKYIYSPHLKYQGHNYRIAMHPSVLSVL